MVKIDDILEQICDCGASIEIDSFTNSAIDNYRIRCTYKGRSETVYGNNLVKMVHNLVSQVMHIGLVIDVL